MPTRRAFLDLCMALGLSLHARASGGAAGPTSAPRPPAPVRGHELTWLELPLAGERGLARRALVLYPTEAKPGRTYPGLLLFHGLGETTNEQIAIHAWRTRYGLEDSVARLRREPLALDAEQQSFIEPEQLAALRAQLGQRPFSGLALICPVTPNPRRNAHPERILDRYAEWIEHTLLPAAREHAPLDGSRGLGVDGCSMGGYVAAEIFARKPHLFRSFGVVQPAVGEYRVAGYARHLLRAQAARSLRGIHLQTSTRDPYRGAVNAWARQLRRQGARFTLDVLPGPHDQRWLRATGTLAMLAWHDYTLG